jgi:hypothetical protein
MPAFDFPSSPTVGQIFGNYTWDGEKWKASQIGDISLSLSANAAYSNVNTAQPWFPSGPTATLEALANYEFEGVLMLTNGVTTHTTAMSFGGTATLVSIGYTAECTSVAVGAVGVAPSVAFAAVATAIVLNPTSVATGTVIKVRGIVRVNVAGTFIPQFTFSAAPGAGNVLANTLFRLRKIS